MAADPASTHEPGHPTWFVLASDGPALELERRAPAGTRVWATADPIAFLDTLRDSRARIAIVTTPPGSDHELEAVARERRRRSGLRAIHLSPAADTVRRLQALRRGFDEALPGTVDAQELADRAALLEERARARRATLEVADGCELDLVAHELRRDGRAVHLRPKEFQLLAMLARHPGRAFTRRQLLDRVWGGDQVGDPRTVDVHVRWLRSKLEQHPERPDLLVTVRGVGYRLDGPQR